MLLTTLKTEVSGNVVKDSQRCNRNTFEIQNNKLDPIHGDEPVVCLGSKRQHETGYCIKCLIALSACISNVQTNPRNYLMVITTILIIMIFIVGLTVTVEDTRIALEHTDQTLAKHGLSENSSQQEILSYILFTSHLSSGVDFINYKNHSSPQSLALTWVTTHMWPDPQHPYINKDKQLKLRDIDLIPYLRNDSSLPPLLHEDYARLRGVLERYSLAVFYYSVRGDSTILSTSLNNKWMSNETHICMWYGITCNTSKRNPYMNSISDISLPSKFLGGQLSYELAYLRDLKSLDIKNNMFVGTVPPSLGTLYKLGTLRCDHDFQKFDKESCLKATNFNSIFSLNLEFLLCFRVFSITTKFIHWSYSRKYMPVGQKWRIENFKF